MCAAKTIAATDMPAQSWIDRLMPGPVRPYLRLMRVDRPIGTWLLLLPCWWSLAMAAQGRFAPWPDPWLFVLFGIGALVMRGAGCTFNDIVDREFDAKVARTCLRPIACGQVSVRQAVVFLGAELLVGLAILLSLNRFAILVGAASLAVVFTYPFMKRITYWPQFVLGLAFNWGALLGWAAVRGSLEAPALLLYVAGISWTLGYDTIYAHQDKEDDILVGVKSTALALGEDTRRWLVGFYVVAIAGLAGSGAWAHLGWPFFAALAVGAAQMAWQVATLRQDDAADCLSKFKSNRYFGLIILAGIVAARVVGS